MSKISLCCVAFTLALGSCFGSHISQTFAEVFQNDFYNQSIQGTGKLPMANIISTPNVQYLKDESGVYFFAYFNGFHTETCLEGDYYGFQIFCDGDGEVFAACGEFHFEEMDEEDMMVHEYDDGTVYTGKAIQIIHFE